MAHLLQNHEGLCRNIHGHSYTLHVCIGGHPLNETGSAKEGMVLDFSDLKKLIQQNILEEFDHCLAINSNLDKSIAEKLTPLNLKIVSLPFEPTSEHLIAHFAEKIIGHIPSPLTLIRLRLYETASSYAEWIAEDQKE